MICTPARIATALIVINLVGGAAALAGASVTPTPVGLTLPVHATYISGLFLVNGLHGTMHLVIGSLGLFATAGTISPEAYLTGHTIWFAGLGLVGLVAVPELARSPACSAVAVGP